MSPSAPSTGCAARLRTGWAAAAAAFYSHPHGDILSRVANDIDNLTTTLQQGTQPASHLGADHRRCHGHDVLDIALLAAVSVVTIPLALVVTCSPATASNTTSTSNPFTAAPARAA